MKVLFKKKKKFVKSHVDKNNQKATLYKILSQNSWLDKSVCTLHSQLAFKRVE